MTPCGSRGATRRVFLLSLLAAGAGLAAGGPWRGIPVKALDLDVVRQPGRWAG